MGEQLLRQNQVAEQGRIVLLQERSAHPAVLAQGLRVGVFQFQVGNQHFSHLRVSHFVHHGLDSFLSAGFDCTLGS